MTNETNNRTPRRNEPTGRAQLTRGESGKTAFAWHFRKLMERLEEILQSLQAIERAVGAAEYVRRDEAPRQ